MNQLDELRQELYETQNCIERTPLISIPDSVTIIRVSANRDYAEMETVYGAMKMVEGTTVENIYNWVRQMTQNGSWEFVPTDLDVWVRLS